MAGISWDTSRDGRWRVTTPAGEYRFDSLVLATPPHVTRQLLASLGGNDQEDGQSMADLLPRRRHPPSSWRWPSMLPRPPACASRAALGFSGPAGHAAGTPACLHLCGPEIPSPGSFRRGASSRISSAATSADALLDETGESLVQRAHEQLGRILGPLPDPQETLVRRWPLSLPQYTVGHDERICRLETLARSWPGLHLVGNAYHGVGLSDLIREGRATARKILGQDA